MPLCQNIKGMVNLLLVFFGAVVALNSLETAAIQCLLQKPIGDGQGEASATAV